MCALYGAAIRLHSTKRTTSISVRRPAERDGATGRHELHSMHVSRMQPILMRISCAQCAFRASGIRRSLVWSHSVLIYIFPFCYFGLHAHAFMCCCWCCCSRCRRRRCRHRSSCCCISSIGLTISAQQVYKHGYEAATIAPTRMDGILRIHMLWLGMCACVCTNLKRRIVDGGSPHVWNCAAHTRFLYKSSTSSYWIRGRISYFIRCTELFMPFKWLEVLLSVSWKILHFASFSIASRIWKSIAKWSKIDGSWWSWRPKKCATPDD